MRVGFVYDAREAYLAEGLSELEVAEFDSPETIDEVAAVMSDVLGRPIRYEPASALGYLRHLRRQGLVVAQAVVQTILHVGLRKGDAEPVTDTVGRLLGRPARTVREYVTDHAQTWSVSGSRSA